MGFDGNDGMFPIAYAIAEAVSKDSWIWFMTNLCKDIGQPGCTFISDQQKARYCFKCKIRHVIGMCRKFHN